MRSFVINSQQVDLDRGQVRGPHGEVALTSNEVKLLGVLARHLGQVVDRDVLLREALGYQAALNTRALDQAVLRLRRKIEPDPHNPRWLLAEPNVGYLLKVDPEPKQRLLGRTDELRQLCKLLDKGLSVRVVGLPGSGRSALIEAAALARTGLPTAPMVPTDAMPLDPDMAVVRIGPLDPQASRALLLRWVLELRRTAALPEADERVAADVADRAGHHPATLRMVAEASVTRALCDIEIGVHPKVEAHIAALSSDTCETLVRCTPFPGPFDAAEVGVSEADLRGAWNACVLDTLPMPKDGRRIQVPLCVRAALPPRPGHVATKAFVAGVVRTLVPAALLLLGRLDESAQDQILRDHARLVAAWHLGSPSAPRELLPVVLAHWMATGVLLVALEVESFAELSADEALCLDLLKAVAAEQNNPSDRCAGKAHWKKGLSRAPSSPALRTYALRFAFSRALWTGQNEDRSTILSELEGLSTPEAPPEVHACLHHCRGLSRLRDGDSQGARDDLLQALSLFGPASIARHTIAENLAGEAARDGRVGEALAWINRADLGRFPLEQEPHRRLQRVALLQLVGRLDDADDELARVEALVGAGAWLLGGPRAAQALLRGQITDAVVLAQQGRADRPVLGQASFACHMVLGWARVAQGLGDDALTVLAAIAPTEVSHADYQAQLALLRAAALSRSSNPAGVDEAARVLDALPELPQRWWPLTRQTVQFLVVGDVPRGVACADQLSAAGLGHLLASFARVALAGPQ